MDLKKKNKILITGAAGFIGGHVVEYFCKKQENIICLVKKTSDISYIKSLSVNIIYGDILNINSMKKAMDEAKTVIHIAGLAKDWGEYEDFYNINVEGTLNVLKACVISGIKQIIITGSISSYGEEDSSEIKDETYPFDSHYKYFLDRIFPSKMNFYRNTKAICTKKAIEYANSKDINLTIIEPVWVYGEHEFNTGFYDFMKEAKSGIKFMPGSKKNKFHVVYAKDLAKAYYLAYIKGEIGINRYIIGNSQADYMHKLYNQFCKELEVKKPHSINKLFTYPLGFLSELIYTIFSKKSPPVLTRGRVNMFYDNIEYSTKKAKKHLNFVNDYSLEEGVKNTVLWYKNNNLI
jgi:nucleoside-diphosphate-sugar epimerase